MGNPDHAVDRAARLRAVLQEHQQRLVSDWVGEVRALRLGEGLSDKAVIDHLPGILDQITRLLEPAYRAEWAKLSELGEAHAVDRLSHGFELDQVVVEYSALRRVIIRTWQRVVASEISVEELGALDEALDESVRQAVVRYAKARERMLRGLNKIADAAAKSSELEPFLRELLHTTIESLPCVDTAVVLVRDQEILRVRAAVGLEEELTNRFHVRIGEGFAGRVASLKNDLLIHDAANNPLVKSPAIRTKGIKALYGVPLMQQGEVIGVAHIGSLSAPDFAHENKLLFRTMASRASSFIAKANLMAELRRGERVQNGVAEVGRVLMASFDVRESLAKVAGVLVPTFGDFCLIDLLEDGGVRRVGGAHADPTKQELVDQLGRDYPPDLNSATPTAKALRTGLPEWDPSIDASILPTMTKDAAHSGLLHRLEVSSYMVVPMLSRRKVVGAITLGYGASHRQYRAEDAVPLEEIAQRLVMAIENARLYEQSRRDVETRDQLLAVVSHDLRNHLSVVSAAAAVVDESADRRSPAAQRSIEAIRRTSSGMSRLVSDLLDSAAIRAGKLSLVLETVELEAILRELANAHAARAKASGIELRTELQAGDVRVKADRHRLEQVFGNLLSNAIQYSTPGDEVRLASMVRGRWAVIIVADTGPGIAPEVVPHLFDPFKRGESRTAGTGLGLYISKGIVERHGGSMECRSVVGKGSTFEIRLPIRAQ